MPPAPKSTVVSQSYRAIGVNSSVFREGLIAVYADHSQTKFVLSGSESSPTILFKLCRVLDVNTLITFELQKNGSTEILFKLLSL